MAEGARAAVAAAASATGRPAAGRPGLKCASCAVVFPDSASHRSHYGTDWHRYNLKRKVAGLGPLAEPVFEARKAAALRQAAAAEAGRRGGADKGSAHLKKKGKKDKKAKKGRKAEQADRKMKARAKANVKAGTADGGRELFVSAFGTKMEAGPGTGGGSTAEDRPEETEDTVAKSAATAATETGTISMPPPAPPSGSGEGAGEGEAKGAEVVVRIDPTDCLFCSTRCGTIGDCLRHMRKAHTFFIPDEEFVVDMNGYLKYLCEKVKIGHMCLYCNEHGKVFQSLFAVQTHMRDKGHCKLLFDEDDDMPEYEDFYDFSKTYAGAGAEGLAAARAAGVVDASADDAGSDVPHVTVDDVTGELVFADGRIAGHRAYRHLYKQHIRSPDMRPETVASRKALEDRGFAGGDIGVVARAGSSSHQLLALGARRTRGRSGPTGLAHLPKAIQVEKKEETRYQLRRTQYEIKMGVQNNRHTNERKYLRPQVIF